MAEGVALKILRCPTCGAELKAKNSTDPITCVYCGNTIVPVAETAAAPRQETVKIAGIKTPASALAYLEQFFEEYDWEAFVYSESLSIPAIDQLVSDMMVTAADDKNTWILCSKACTEPLLQKLKGWKRILGLAIEEYKKDSLDAYSKYDAYKRIAAMINTRKDALVASLEKYICKAEKYGAAEDELSAMRAEAAAISSLPALEIYGDVEQIPEIKAYNQELDEKIAKELAAKGIDAQAAYQKARSLIEDKKYVEALNILLSLEGYADSEDLAEKLDKYFLISDVLELEGKLYYFKKSEGAEVLNLHPTENGHILPKPIIKGISQIVTNYADTLYYLDGQKKLKRYNLSTNVEEKFDKKKFDKDGIYIRDQKAYMLTVDTTGYESAQRELMVLDMAKGNMQVLLEKVQKVLSFQGNKLIYTHTEKTGEGYESKILTSVLDIATMKSVHFGTKKVTVEGFVDDCVIYTQESPNQYNRNLYVQSMEPDQPEMLVEQNILRFCNVISGKLFYYIGNTANQTFVTIDPDGTGRREWPRFISRVLLEQGGWLYFIRKAGYNSILCKARLDGSRYGVIAADIDEFVALKNGYLYYINDESALVKVRMDGSNLQVLCKDVEQVLSVKEDKIVFVSVDDRVAADAATALVTPKIVKSLYAVDFTGSGKIKLAYDVKQAKAFDEDTVYYIAAEAIFASYEKLVGKLNVLYRLDVDTYRTEELLELEFTQESTTPVGAIVFAVLGILIGLIGIASEEPAVGLMGLAVGFISAVIAVARKLDKS